MMLIGCWNFIAMPTQNGCGNSETMFLLGEFMKTKELD